MDTYPYKKSPSLKVFYFKSIGPKGVIPKAVLFTAIEPLTFNLGLISKVDGKWQDKELSNNADMYKTFRTIYQIFIEFTSFFTHVRIYIEGNSIHKKRGEVSKNIAYEKHILGLLSTLIESGFEVEGFINDDWKKFEKGKNYEAFLVTKV